MVREYCAAFRVFVCHLGLTWRKTQKENFILLGGAFMAAGALPIRRMARALEGPFEQLRYADRRLRRFLGNVNLDHVAMEELLAAQLRFILARMPGRAYIPVSVDWLPREGDRAVLWVQIPYRGRALPLFSSVVAGPAPSTRREEESRQTREEKALLERLRRCWPPGFPPPLLLMDRGFDKGPLLKWLLDEGWLFIVRAKRNYLYDHRGHVLHGRLSIDPGRVRLFPNVRYTQKSRIALHLVLSCDRDRKTQQPSAWRLLTNLPEADLLRAPKLYALRMSQEQVHRDSKTGAAVSGFALAHLKRLRRDRLERLICLLSVIYCFLVLIAEGHREARQWLLERNWGLSLAMFALELLRVAGSLARRLARDACARVKFQPQWE